MTQPIPTPTHQAVQEHYGKVARESASCCGPAEKSSSESSCCGAKVETAAENILYPAELVAGIPTDIVSASAGSGDPVSLAALKQGETVLDLGSGGGLDCFLSARLIGESGRVIGVDMTPDMLDLARRNQARVNQLNIEFREGFLESLPVESASVDVVISNCVINLSPDKPQVLREMFRVLKPGGRIAISDIVTNRPIAAEVKANPEDWCDCTAGALQREEYTAALKDAGFTEISLDINLDVVRKAVESGQVRSQENLTKEQIIEDLKHPEKINRLIVAPYNITAVKPV